MKIMLSFVLVFIIIFIPFAYTQSQDVVPYERDFVPYTENYNVRFDSDGRIDYDLLIAKIMPDIFERKLHDLEVNVNTKDIVLNRGFQHAIYESRSYNCGYTIDPETKQVYWLEAAINSTHIQYADIYNEIPRDDTSKAGYFDCFTTLEIQIAERFLEEKSYFTAEEEILAASAVKHYLRGNENLNKYQFTIGKFNFDYKDDDVILSFCGKFEGRLAGNEYFSGILKKSETDFGLKSSLPQLCAVNYDATLYDIKFKENPNLDKSLQTWKNSRMETVHVNPSSIEKLLERDYLYVNSINHSILYYASHLTLEHVDYQPENSSTILKFTPSEKDSYMKIRLRDTGVSYYQSYGFEDWNVGKLLGLSILVDGKETSYTQSPYVKSPEAPYPQHYTDSVFKIPANSTNVEVKLDVENYNFDEENSDWTWRDY